MISHIGWGGERNTRLVDPEGVDCEVPLFLKGVDTRQLPVKTLGSKGVDYDVPHWLGRRTKHPLGPKGG